MAVKRSASPQGRMGGISIAAAKYSSEDCATLVQYTIAIVEYTRRCGPLKASMERMHELEREIEENERMQKQAEAEVLWFLIKRLLFLMKRLWFLVKILFCFNQKRVLGTQHHNISSLWVFHQIDCHYRLVEKKEKKSLFAGALA